MTPLLELHPLGCTTREEHTVRPPRWRWFAGAVAAITAITGTVAATSTSAAPTGPQKILVLRVKAADDNANVANRWDKTQAEAIFGKLNDLWKQTSYGKMSLDVTVTDQYALPGNEDDYRTGDILENAEWSKVWKDAAASAPSGLNWNDLKGVVVLFKDDTTNGIHRGAGNNSCTVKKGPGATSNITPGCVVVWENKGETETAAWGRIAHELGHAFQQNNTPAHPSNYNNEFELMDSNYPGHTGAFEKQQGKAFTDWMPESKYINVVPNVSGSAPSWAPSGSAVGGANIDLHALEHDPANEPTAQVARVYTASQSMYFLVSVRRKINGDELNPIPDEGILIERVVEGGVASQNDCPSQPTPCPRWVNVVGPGGDRNRLWKGDATTSSVFDNGVLFRFKKYDDDHYGVSVSYDMATRPDVAVTPWRSAPLYRWESQDIWVDSPVNGYGTFRYGSLTSTYGDSVPAGNGDDPAVGQVNRLYARVRNLGTQPATNVKVHIDRTDPEGRGINGANGFTNVGTQTIASIPAGGYVDTYVDYTPSFTPTPEQIAAGTFGYHTCLRIRIDGVPNELVLGNQDGNGEQENIDTFQAVNTAAPTPGDYTDIVRLRNDDNVNKKSFSLSYTTSQLPADWSVTLNGGDDVVELEPGEVRDVKVLVQSASHLPVGALATIDVQASMRHQFVDPTQPPGSQVHDETRHLGGVTIEARGMKPSSITCRATRRRDATGRLSVTITGRLTGLTAEERRSQTVYVQGLLRGDTDQPVYLTRTGSVLKLDRNGRFTGTFTAGQWLEADHAVCLYAGTDTIASSGFGPTPIRQA